MKIRMKKKNMIYVIVYILMVAVICISAGVVQHRKDKKTAEALAELNNYRYTRCLYIKGEFSYEGNKVYVEDIEYDYNQLMVDVAFFNYDHVNEQITVEQLYEEYEGFLNGEETDVLDKFADYDNGDIGNDYSLYVASISYELRIIREEKQRNGEDVSIEVSIQSATPEELQEAIDRVNERKMSAIHRMALLAEDVNKLGE